MLLPETFCYILLTITVIATGVQSQKYDDEVSGSGIEKRIVRREASVIIDSYPLESIIKRSPRVIVKRVSRGRYRKPKPKYGPPKRKPLGRSRRPNQKKSMKKPHKYPRSGYQTGPTKARYKSPRPPKAKYGPPKHVPPQVFKAPEQEGFGEPPAIYPPNDNLSPKPFGEPPVDSYGSPLKPLSDPYPAAQNYRESQFYDLSRHKDHLHRPDQNFASSEKHQVYAKPDIDMDENTDNLPIDYNDDLNSYSHHLKIKSNNDLIAETKKPLNYGEKQRFIARPWKLPNTFEENDDKILVGGLMAEPPARYVPKFQPSAPMYVGEDEFVPPGFVDSEIPASATMSPYVNYKNSNMAFSPQNLNDAFSIVDK